jgi:glutamate--cysteine ligase
MSDVIEGAKLKVDPTTGVVVGLALPSDANFSLEPGGQIEFSSSPRLETGHIVQDVVAALEALENASQGQVFFLSHGTNPIAPADMPLLVPKERYQILRRYFESEPNGRGKDMMSHTATVQPNIDINGDDSDWEDAVRLTFALTPAVQTLTRNSDFFAGRRSTYRSERQNIWLHTDSTRSGTPPGIVKSQDVACNYAQWARQANVFLVRGIPPDEQPKFGELTFEQYLSEGYKGIMPTLQDWELHLATLFPELRLRGFLEIRSLDAQPFEHIQAGVMLWKGLLTDPQARAEAWSLFCTQSIPKRHHDTLGSELLNLATESLRRMGDELGVAALCSATHFWLERANTLEMSEPLEFVRLHAREHPSRDFVSSIERAGLRWGNSRGHPGWGGSQR